MGRIIPMEHLNCHQRTDSNYVPQIMPNYQFPQMISYKEQPTKDTVE